MLLVVLAVAVHLHWTAPPQNVTGYIGYRSWDHGRTWERAKLWMDDAFTTPHVATAQPGGQDGAFVWTDAPYRNDMLVRISAFNAGGFALVSNEVIISTGLRDTLYSLTRGDQIGPLHIPIMQEWAWPHDGTQDWKLAPGDSAAFQVMDYEQVARQMQVYLCQVHGFYNLWGTAQPCP